MSASLGGGEAPSGPFWLRLLVAGAAGILTLATVLTGSAFGDPPRGFQIQFDSEWIRLAVVGDSLEVRGTYYLTCRQRSGMTMSLFYPFPQDSLLGGVRMISVAASVDGDSADEIEWQDSPGAPGVRWRTPPCTGDTIVIDTVYRQELLTDYARYIVTTTRTWRLPLRLARFEIRLPPGAVPTEFSFPFERREDAAGRYYAFDAHDFFPDRDVVVRWKQAQAE